MEYPIVCIQPCDPSGIDRQELLKERVLEANVVQVEAIFAFSETLFGQEALVMAPEVPDDPERRGWDWMDHAMALHLLTQLTRLWSMADLTRASLTHDGQRAVKRLAAVVEPSEVREEGDGPWPESKRVRQQPNR